MQFCKYKESLIDIPPEFPIKDQKIAYQGMKLFSTIYHGK